MAGNSGNPQTRRDPNSPGAYNFADTPFGGQNTITGGGDPYGMGSLAVQNKAAGEPISQGPYPAGPENRPNDPYGMGGEGGNQADIGPYGIPTGGLTDPVGTNYSPSASSYNFNFGPGRYEPNPYLGQQAENITRGFNRNLQEQVLPGLRSKFIGSGGLGGSRQGIAEGLAAGRSGEGLSSAITNMYAQDYENSQNRGMQGSIAGMNAGLQARNMDLQDQMNRLNSERNFYSTNRGQDISQMGLAAGLLGQANQGFMGQGQGIYGLGLQEQNAPWQQLQNYSGLIGPYTQAGATRENTQTSTYNPWMQGLGTAFQGATALGGLGWKPFGG